MSAPVFVFLFFIVFSWANEWRPRAKEIIYEGEKEDPLPDTITILSWNIGYAGLGADMDFFMDGGKQTRASREKYEENLDKIVRFLVESDADMILLQEVDRDSKRSYEVDQFALLQDVLTNYQGYFALNYRSPFVPVPIRAPLGKVTSGVALFSKIEPNQVVRYQYNSRFSFPVRLFNLKRCWLAAGFEEIHGNTVWISVTHNTAYDTGDMRKIEMDQLYNWLNYKPLTITGGDWNQNPPEYKPSVSEINNPYFSPRFIPEHADFQYVYDASIPSVRYLDKPLDAHTTKTLIDFFLLSKNVDVLEIKTIDLGFRHSDHNPVLLRARIGK